MAALFSPSTLIGVVTQPTDSRLSETKIRQIHAEYGPGRILDHDTGSQSRRRKVNRERPDDALPPAPVHRAVRPPSPTLPVAVPCRSCRRRPSDPTCARRETASTSLSGLDSGTCTAASSATESSRQNMSCCHGRTHSNVSVHVA